MNNLLGALKSMQRNFTMTFASVILVSLTLLVIGFIGIIAMNTSYITNNVLKTLTINVYVSNAASEEEIKIVEDEIKKIEEVNTVEYSSKEQELALLSDELGNEQIVEFYSGEANPLESVFVVTVDDAQLDMEAVAEQIKLIPNVTDVKYGGGGATDNFISTMLFIQKVSIVIALLLIFVSMFIIINTIKLTITARRDEIEIMRLVGATKMYIRLPFMFEGLIIGLIGGIIGALLLMIGYDQILTTQLMTPFKSSLLELGDVVIFLIIGLPLCGMIIGSFSSYLATIKYLNK
jgi:cell division transport system permease protein